jgi:hypothetical protein
MKYNYFNFSKFSIFIKQVYIEISLCSDSHSILHSYHRTSSNNYFIKSRFSYLIFYLKDLDPDSVAKDERFPKKLIVEVSFIYIYIYDISNTNINL